MTATFARKTLFIFLLLVTSNMSAEAVEIRLRNDAAVRSSIVRMGDVAEVVATGTEDVRRWERVELFATPVVGSVRTLRAKEVRELLTLRDFDLTTVRVTGADFVEIRSAASATSAATNLPEKVDQTRLPVVVPTRTIARGETIRKGDVELRTINRIAKGFQYVNRLEDVLGREATRQLEPIQPVDSRWLQQPLLVRRNETISIIARAAGVQVRTNAKALEDGIHGDQIIVESLEGKKRNRFTARVSGFQEAEIFAGLVSTVSNSKD